MRHRTFTSRLIFTAATTVAGLAVPTSSGRADIVYVSNWNNSTIEKFDSVTGANLGIFANIAGPRGVALDSGGNLYAVSYSNQQILRYTPAGVASVFATISGHPEGLAFDSAGNLFMADYVANTITKFTPGGSSSIFANTGLNQPYGLAFDTAGNLYAANNHGNSIEKFTPGGVGSVFATGLNGPIGLAFDNAANLYAANYNGQSIQKFTSGGSSSIFASGFADPSGLAFDSAGNLYVADQWATPNYGAVYKVTSAGVVSTFASTFLSGPVYIAIQPVPEPSVLALLCTAPMLLWALRRRFAPLTAFRQDTI